MGKKIIINEDKLRAIVRNILIEQAVDLETALKEMGFVKTTPGNYKHNKESKLTISIIGNNVIVKKDGKELGKVTKGNIEDLEGIVKSSFPTMSESFLHEQSSQRDKVKKIQQKLVDLGYNLGTSGPNKNGVDGAWGKMTNKAWSDWKAGKNPTNVPVKNTQTIKKTGPKNILVSDTLVNKKIVFDPTMETKPLKCSPEMGCSEWVSNQLEDLGVQRQGNAWHSHNINQKSLEKSPFINLSPDIQNQMASLFGTINANPVEKSQESAAKALVNKLIPQQESFRNILNVNDIVGLYWDGSDNFTKAFFEGATGMSDMGKGYKITNGPYFRRADNGQPWSESDLDKKIKFVPGNSLKNGSGFGLNTHLGYVGAKVDGEPIIFHNVHGTIHATPLSKMGKTKVLWVKSGPGEVIKPKETAPDYFESLVKFLF